MILFVKKVKIKWECNNFIERKIKTIWIFKKDKKNQLLLTFLTMTWVIRSKTVYIKKLWGLKSQKKKQHKKIQKKNTIKIINVKITIKNKSKGNKKF